jgi:hypothetical protein
MHPCTPVTTAPGLPSPVQPSDLPTDSSVDPERFGAMKRYTVSRTHQAVELTTDLPFSPDEVAEAIGGAFHTFFQGRRPEIDRSFSLELPFAIVLLLFGIRGWDVSRTLAPLRSGGCRMTDYAYLDSWIPFLAPVHLRIVSWRWRIRHARIRRRLIASLGPRAE